MRTLESVEDEGTPQTEDGGGGDGASGGAKEHIDRLTKLFPVEGVTLYPLVLGIAGDDDWIRYTGIGVLAAAIVVARSVATRPEKGGSPLWGAVAVSVVAYLIYVFSMGGFGLVFGDDSAERHYLLGAAISGLFTWMLGVFKFALPAEPAS